MDKIDYDTKMDDKALYQGRLYTRIEGPWTLYQDINVISYVKALADSPYRLRIALGLESLSGLTLHTGARSRREYQDSASMFIKKLESMGLHCREVQGNRRARILLIG